MLFFVIQNFKKLRDIRAVSGKKTPF